MVDTSQITPPLPSSNVYTPEELSGLIGSFGDDVRIDRSVRFFGGKHIRIGHRVRIDCFGLITAGPEGVGIGNNIHLAAGCYLFGSGARITLHDFAGLSARVTIYTASDDYTSGFLTGPTIPDEFRKIKAGSVTVGRHAIVGAGSVILPGITLGLGAAVGALTVVRKNVRDCEVVYGNPMERLPRYRDADRLRSLEAAYLAELFPREGT